MIFNIMGTMGRISTITVFSHFICRNHLCTRTVRADGEFHIKQIGWSRRKTTTVLCIVGCAFSLILTTGISSYLVGLIDSFVNQFGVILLIPIQAIIFGWIYGLDNVIPVLNKNSIVKVGTKWKIIIKYIAPVVLFILWVFGIIKLFSNANSFEITIYIIITVAVLAFSWMFSKRKSPE